MILSGLGNFYCLLRYRGRRLGDRRNEGFGLPVFVLAKVNDHTGAVFSSPFPRLTRFVTPKISMTYDEPGILRASELMV
jgi:hypothetical protein